jgi:methylenetetrahydrofolate reductase (NADPH)
MSLVLPINLSQRMTISFEIVPRSIAAFEQQYTFVQTLHPAVNIINIPDIQRFELRSWELAAHIDRHKYRFIPHFRAIDFKLSSGELCSIIDRYQLDSILLVTGDPPEGLKRAYYNTDVVELIRDVRKTYPDLNIYAGFDPHRSGVKDECDYIQRKIDAGANGFFSQPFYDSRMIEIYAEQMRGAELYIGISPITSKASMNYWEVKNKVKFPSGFQPEYDWNIKFANSVITLAKQLDFNIYFMPIRIDLTKYFEQLQF